jgi:hypothetical protein
MGGDDHLRSVLAELPHQAWPPWPSDYSEWVNEPIDKPSTGSDRVRHARNFSASRSGLWPRMVSSLQ